MCLLSFTAALFQARMELAGTLMRVGPAAVLGVGLARRGLKKRSLSPDGAAAALLACVVILGTSPTLGAVLFAFYISGTAFTRVGSGRKAAYDLDVKGGGGLRDAWQVLCTAGVGAGLCVEYLRLTGGVDEGACVTSGAYLGLETDADAHRSALLLAFLGSFACVCGDTWASELGILSSSRPVLVTSLLTCSPRRVPRGTNGGVSVWGTVCSAAGGASMGAVMALDPLLRAALGWSGRVPSCRVGGGDVPAAFAPQLALVLVGALAGLTGSLIDSLLGATLQRSWYDPATGRVAAALPPGVVEGSACCSAAVFEAGEKAAGLRATAGAGVPPAPPPSTLLVIGGHPLLSNTAVNILSSALTAALTALWGDAAMRALAVSLASCA